jgi:phage host-nuclease inhibitor protein Gam
MEEEIKSLREEIKELKQAVDDIVTAWKAANFFLGIVKWVAGIGTGLIAILAFFKGVK